MKDKEPRSPWRARVLKTAIALVAFLAVPLFFEVGLRLINKPGWEKSIVAGWKSMTGGPHINQLGFRGQRITYTDNDIVVVLLGDSHVESTASSFETLPEQLLQKHLAAADPRYKVFSIGSGGYGNDQQFFALKEYFAQYRADFVVLWQTFGNDIWNNVFPTHWPKDGYLKPTFWLENGELKGPNYQYGQVAQKAAQTKLGVFINRIRDPRKGLDASWESRLPKPYTPLTDYHGPYQMDWDPAGPNKEINPLLKDENLETEKSHQAVFLTPRSERMLYGLQLTRKILELIDSLCRQNKSKLALFYVLDDEEQEKLRRQDPVVQKRGDRFYKSSLSQFNANREFVNHGFVTIPALVTVPDRRVSKSDGHLNPAANDQVVGILADGILAGPWK
jgi:hypothetical protein